MQEKADQGSNGKPVTASRPENDEDWSDSSDSDEPVLGRRGWMRLVWLAVAVLVIVLLATLPPLVNVNRYQRRVAQAISGSIGRPVHFDSITMHLLPLPGFTIQNLVVQEDPAFGAEPAMRSNVVQARVRFASLWRRRIEISRIRLEAPSVNLVRRPDGKWNLQSVVLQAAQLESAPTAQRNHGDAPRFPYIEAADARINIKQGQDKLPWSLVDAKFSLWLPNQNEWKLRLEGRPLRTDTDVSDVGTLRMEGTLGRSNNGSSGEKLDLQAQMTSTPMGEAAKLVLGHDTGWRGAASADLSVHGTSADMRLTADLHLHNLRRAEFVPRLPMSVDAHCDAQTTGGFRQVRNIRCAIPTLQSTSLLEAIHLFDNKEEHVITAPDVLSITADLPDTQDWHSATAQALLRRGSPQWALDWLRLFSTRLPAEEQVTGYVTLQAQLNSGGDWNWEGRTVCHCSFPKADTAEKTEHSEKAGENKLNSQPQSPAEGSSLPAGAISPANSWMIVLSHAATPGDPADIGTIAVNAGPAPAETVPAKEDVSEPQPSLPTNSTITGQISKSGYTLRYISADVARNAAALLPPLGDGLSAELTGPVQAERKWNASQTWTEAPSSPIHTSRRPARRRAR